MSYAVLNMVKIIDKFVIFIVMSKTLIKLANRIHEDYSDNLQDIFNNLNIFIKENSDYFSRFSAEDIVYLTYYIYSINRFGNLEVAQKVIIPDLFVASFFFYSKEDKHLEECGECDGRGNIDCTECNGVGTVSCSTCSGEGEVDCNDCNGNGNVDCEDCDGTGEIDGEDCSKCNGNGENTCVGCGGDGEHTCSDCNGEGEERCFECSGSGNESCPNCDDGEITTEELDYEINDYLIYDEKLVNYLFKEWNDNKPMGTELEFTSRPTVLNISSRTEHAFFDEEKLKDKNFYCFGVSKLSDTPLHRFRRLNGVSPDNEPDIVSYR